MSGTVAVPNMNGVEAAGIGGSYPDGWHRVKCESAVADKSSNGYPQIHLQFSGKYGNIQHWITLQGADEKKTNTCLQFFKQALDAFGLEFGGGDFNPASMQGRTVDILTRLEPGWKDKSKFFPKIQGFRAATGPAPVIEANAATAAPPSGWTPTTPPGPGASEDDIPF